MVGPEAARPYGPATPLARGQGVHLSDLAPPLPLGAGRGAAAAAAGVEEDAAGPLRDASPGVGEEGAGPAWPAASGPDEGPGEVGPINEGTYGAPRGMAPPKPIEGGPSESGEPAGAEREDGRRRGLRAEDRQGVAK